MKTCLSCKRNYDDDTLFFCLEDGTSLSPAVAGPGKPGQRDANPPATEVFPASKSRSVLAEAPRVTQPQQRTTKEAGAKSTGGPWIVVGGLVAGLVVLLIGVGGYLAWSASRSTSTEQPQTQTTKTATTPTPTATNTNVKSPPAATPAPTANPNWLEGIWEGKGYQTDTNSTWSVRLTIRDDNFSISYPDIPCSGVWAIVDQNSTGGTFREIISKNVSNCANNSQIILQKVTDNELTLKYSHENTREVIATATLRKRLAKKD